MRKSEFLWMASIMQPGKIKKVKPTKKHIVLPIGPTARIAFQIDELRGGCSRAAQAVLGRVPLNESELEECARLDDALARAHRLLKATVRGIMLARLKRSGRARSGGK